VAVMVMRMAVTAVSATTLQEGRHCSQSYDGDGTKHMPLCYIATKS